MSNNYFGQPQGFGGYNNQFGGTMYNNNGFQQPQNTVMRQLLTENQIKELQQAPQTFSTKLTHGEYLKAICTHKDPNTGAITLQETNDGRYHCTICGETFRLIDPSESREAIENICMNFNDVFQSIKTYYGDAPDSFRDFYLMSGFISKIPYLWDIAKKYFERIPMGMNGVQPTNDQYGWQLLNNIFGNNMMGNVVPGMGMGNNMYMGQPAYPQNNGWGQPQQPQYNQPTYTNQPPVNPGYPNTTQFNAPPQQPYPNQVNQPGYSMPNYYAGNAQGNPYNNPPQMPSTNPIGFVEQPQQDFTSTTTQKVSVPMPGPSVNAGTQPSVQMPEPPKNPNIKDPKATVNKSFK